MEYGSDKAGNLVLVSHPLGRFVVDSSGRNSWATRTVKLQGISPENIAALTDPERDASKKGVVINKLADVYPPTGSLTFKPPISVEVSGPEGSVSLSRATITEMVPAVEAISAE